MVNEMIDEKPKARKTKERRSHKGYWYRCLLCNCPHGDYEESQVGKIVECPCGNKMEIVK